MPFLKNRSGGVRPPCTEKISAFALRAFLSPKRGKRRCPLVAFLLPLIISVALTLPTGCSPPEKDFPLDLRQVIPENWQPKRLEKINIDGDGETEWLLLYRYTSLPHRPWGGVIYDAQMEACPECPKVKIPDRPAYLVPYRLLPDLGPGKGQGYLGEKGCDFTLYDTDGDDKNDELAIWGSIDRPTQLALFRWDGKKNGYRVIGFFYGDGGIKTELSQGKGTRIAKVTVRTRLHDRNEICQKTVYQRREGDFTYELVEGPALAFLTDELPKLPCYPEAAILAYHLARRREEKWESYITEKGVVSMQDFEQREEALAEALEKGQIICLDYPEAPSLSFTVEEEGGLAKIKPLNYADIETTLKAGNGQWKVTWRVIKISPERIKEDVFWKVDGIISTRRLSR